ncbi:hypothetical protein [Niallia sp. 01092]|uniref:hypothetical protein n=1 Tax=unclassified Niallia TaxID=2837522 RepID=UPI003FD12F25
MDNEKQFLSLLKPIKRSLLMELLAKELHFLLLEAGGVLLFGYLLANIFVIPFIYWYIFACCGVILLVFIIRLWMKYPTSKQAVALFNEYVAEDYAITAFHYLHSNGAKEQVVVQQALQEMKIKQFQVFQRKKNYFYPKLMILAFLCFASYAVLLQFPSSAFQFGKEKEKEIKVIAKTKKELDKKITKEPNKNIADTLKKIDKELNKSDTVKKALHSIEKETKKLQLKSNKEINKKTALENTEKQLKDSGLNSLAEALAQKNAKLLEKEWKDANRQYKSLTAEQKNALNQLSGYDRKLTEEQLKQMMKQMEDMLQSESKLQELASAQNELASLNHYLQQQSTANGITTPNTNTNTAANTNPSSNTNQTAQNNTNPNANNGAGRNNPSNPNGNNGNGSENGKGSGNGNGSGSGNGSGNGNGNGNGNGSGSASGSGSGIGAGGSGASFGTGSRELLSIPDKVKGKQNQETDTGVLGNGKQGELSEGNGPVLKGNVQPYDQVYADYEQSYRESTDRYKLPSDLEGIVKNYFSTINPNEK